MTRSRGNKDANQDAIVEGLRAHRLSVAVTSTVAARTPHLKGFPDLVVGGDVPCPHCGGLVNQTVLVEVKDPGKPPSERRLSVHETDFHQRWRGAIAVVQTIDEGLRIFGLT
jgi:hypothetical protein